MRRLVSEMRNSGAFPRTGETTMKMKSRVKAGQLTHNHNLRVKTRVKAGQLTHNHNLTVR
jgi:hypothetical protein